MFSSGLAPKQRPFIDHSLGPFALADCCVRLALYATTSAFRYLAGDTALHDVIVQGSSATSLNAQAGQGGGVFLADGNLVMSERTWLTGNSASGSGAQYIATSGKATYLLPAPPGTWINGLQCIVYREACAVDEKGNLEDPNCETTSQACQYESVHNANVSGTQCRPLLPEASQPCDWCAQPLLEDDSDAT